MAVLSSANKAEPWKSFSAGVASDAEKSGVDILNIRLRQAVPASFSQNDDGFFDSALSADAYRVAICCTLKRSLVTPRCGHSSSCAMFIHVATRGSRSVNFSLTIWFKSKICLHLAVCVG